MTGLRRLTMVALVGLLSAGLVAGCGGSPPGRATPSAGAPTATRSPLDPAVDAVCADSEKVIIDSTATFTAAIDRAVAAAERGDPSARELALGQVRAAFQDWSTKLRADVSRTSDLGLQATLTEYAGAVDAAIARVKSADDLDQLSSFDDRELDTAANHFQLTCGS